MLMSIGGSMTSFHKPPKEDKKVGIPPEIKIGKDIYKTYLSNKGKVSQHQEKGWRVAKAREIPGVCSPLCPACGQAIIGDATAMYGNMVVMIKKKPEELKPEKGKDSKKDKKEGD